MIPSVIDNQQHRLGDLLNELLARCAGGPVDVATAYFAISGYRLEDERPNRWSTCWTGYSTGWRG